MLKFITNLLLMIAGASTLSATPNNTPAEHLYVKTFGNPSDQSIIFLHGGPAFHSYSFEVTTAEKLASLGFYVVVYDRTGEGRSDLPRGYMFNFANALKDLHSITQSLETRPILLGHSFGGTIALKYVESYPEATKGTIFVASPLSYPRTLLTLLRKSRLVAKRNNCQADPSQFDFVQWIIDLEQDFSTAKNHSRELVGGIFAAGIQCGLYNQPTPTEEALSLMGRMTDFPPMESPAFAGFLESESYSQLNLESLIGNLASRTWAIFGDSDGLFDDKTEDKLVRLLGRDHVTFLSNSSHDVFIHQQTKFLEQIEVIVESIR